MKEFVRTISNAPYAILAAGTIAMASPTAATAAESGKSIGDVAGDLTTNMGQFGKLMAAGGFVAGIVMLATGLLKLKQAAEDQGRTKYSEGAWRIGVGAGLVALAGFNDLLGQSFGLGDTDFTTGEADW